MVESNAVAADFIAAKILLLDESDVDAAGFTDVNKLLLVEFEAGTDDEKLANGLVAGWSE